MDVIRGSDTGTTLKIIASASTLDSFLSLTILNCFAVA
jgi:hypothetical protein